jgi:type IV pilus assembly protein PilE
MRTHRLIYGFTLIELMIVVAVIAILSVIAVPSYQQYVIRTNRASAETFMLRLASLEEQYLLDAHTYAASSDVNWTSSTNIPSELQGIYTFSITKDNGPPPAYTITATPVSGTRQAQDGALTLNSQGVKTPAAKWQR